MEPLSLTLLGVPTVFLGGRPIHIRRRKALALLIYLAVSQTKHSRGELAALFWPQQAEVPARNNLRRALYTLHRLLGQSVPLIEDDTVALPIGFAVRVDVVEFRRVLADSRLAFNDSAPTQAQSVELERVVALYQEDFARGLSLDGCPEFEAWQREQAENLRADLAWALTALVDGYARLRTPEPAIKYARRLLALNPYDEKSLQRLMQLYAQTGQAASAIRLYERQAELRAQDLGLLPAQETQRLQREIRDGAWLGTGSLGVPSITASTDQTTQLTTLLTTSTIPQTNREHPPFVAREHALAELTAHLLPALTANGRIVFVTGDAGSGKTTLIREFTRRASQEHPGLVIAYGACAVHFGDGDPYLPFREILQDLLKGKGAAGVAVPATRGRPHQLAATTIEALLNQAPSLVETFVGDANLQSLIERESGQDGDWQRAMTELLAQRQARQAYGRRLHEEYAAVLRTLARQWPLLLVLDDLHWADTASLNFLLYLARHVAGNRILVVGAFRPEEVAWQTGESRALLALVEELQRQFGQCRVSLDQAAVAEGRHFVDALLDLRPNRLDESFRQALFAHSRGHALFTVELLRQMREQDDIVEADDGRWVEAAVRWAVLPSRVEAVITRRLHRLPDALFRVLSVASVEGEKFSAEIVASVLDMDVDELIGELSHSLDARYHLVHGIGVRRIGSQRLSRYRFHHSLFQHYLYQSIDVTERQLLHEAVGAALEAFHGRDPQTLPAAAPALARHFEEAGLVTKAIEYRRLAGQRAARIFAHGEAMRHLERALALVRSMEPGHDRAELELAILLELSVPMAAHSGYGHESLANIYADAMVLATQSADLDREFQAVHGKWRYRVLRGDLTRGLELAPRLAEIAESGDDDDQRIEAWRARGATHFHSGNLAEARLWLERCFAHYDTDHHSDHMHIYGHDPGISARGYLAHVLWLQACPDAAVTLTDETIRDARTLDHPFSLAHALGFNGTHIYQFVGDAARVLDLAQECATLAEEDEFPMWSAASEIFAGWAETAFGRVDAGIERTEFGIALWRRTGSRLALSYHLGLLADAHRMANQPELGLTIVDEALAAAEQSCEHWWKPELHRLKGDLLRMSDAEPDKIRSCYMDAISLARKIGATSLALRAESSLAHTGAT